MKIKHIAPFYSEFNDVKPLRDELLGNVEHEFIFDPVHGPYVDRNRNKGISCINSDKIHQTPSKHHDACLFNDSDIKGTKKDVFRMLEHLQDVDIICAPYLTHGSDSIYQCGKWGDHVGIKGENYTTEETGIQKIDWCGAGFLMVNSKTFDELDYPWFGRTYFKVNDTAIYLGEDIDFCMKLYGKYNIYCDFDIKIEHRNRDSNSFDWD